MYYVKLTGTCSTCISLLFCWFWFGSLEETGQYLISIWICLKEESYIHLAWGGVKHGVISWVNYLFNVEHKRRYFVECWLPGPINIHYIFCPYKCQFEPLNFNFSKAYIYVYIRFKSLQNFNFLVRKKYNFLRKSSELQEISEKKSQSCDSVKIQKWI